MVKEITFSLVYSTLVFVYLLKWIIDAVNVVHMMQNSLVFPHRQHTNMSRKDDDKIWKLQATTTMGTDW